MNANELAARLFQQQEQSNRFDTATGGACAGGKAAQQNHQQRCEQGLLRIVVIGVAGGLGNRHHVKRHSAKYLPKTRVRTVRHQIAGDQGNARGQRDIEGSNFGVAPKYITKLIPDSSIKTIATASICAEFQCPILTS